MSSEHNQNESTMSNNVIKEISENYPKDRNHTLFIANEKIDYSDSLIAQKGIGEGELIMPNENISNDSSYDIPWKDQEQERQIALSHNDNSEIINTTDSQQTFNSIKDLTASSAKFDNMDQQRSQIDDQLSLLGHKLEIPNKPIQNRKAANKPSTSIIQGKQIINPVVIKNSSNREITEPHCLEIASEVEADLNQEEQQAYQTEILTTKVTGELSGYQESDFYEPEFDQRDLELAEVDNKSESLVHKENSLADQLVQESFNNYLAANPAQQSTSDDSKTQEKGLSPAKTEAINNSTHSNSNDKLNNEMVALAQDDLGQKQLMPAIKVATSATTKDEEKWITKDNREQTDSDKTAPTIAVDLSSNVPNAASKDSGNVATTTPNTTPNAIKAPNPNEVKEDDDDEIKEDEENKETNSRPTPPANRGWWALFISNGGVTNRRVFGAVAAILIVVCIIWAGKGTSEGQSNQSTGDKARTLPVPQEEVRTIDNSDISRSDLGKVDRNEWNENKEPLPKVTIPPMPPPMTPIPKPVATPSPSPIATPTPKLEPRSFAAVLRGGEKADIIPIPTKVTPAEPVSLEGAQILLRMVEPFRSGIASIVKAEVLADVKDAKDTIIIPAHSIARIPFISTAVSGRVINNVGNSTSFILPNGNKVLLKGFVKGEDGLDGLAGKLTDKKGNIVVRSMKGLGRVGARVIGLESGNYTGAILESSINQTIDSSVPYTPSGPIIEVKIGTRFTFNVLQ